MQPKSVWDPKVKLKISALLKVRVSIRIALLLKLKKFLPAGY